MKKSYLCLALLAFIYTASTLCGENIKINAVSDSAKVNFKNETFSADGGIRLSYKKIKIQADKIYKEPKKAIVIATGNVIFEQSGTIIEADRVEVNLHSQKAIIENGHSYSSKMFFGGDKLQAEFPSKGKVEKAYFTSDYNLDNPTYHFEAQKMIIIPNEKIEAYNVSFYAGIHKIFWFPYYATALSDDGGRNTLFPRFGSSSKYGSYVIWGVNYKTLPYKYASGYVDFMYSSKLGWLFTLLNELKFSDDSKGSILVQDVNIPRKDAPPQWDLQLKYHSNTPKDRKFNEEFFQENSWDLFYQNLSTNLLIGADGIPIDQENSYYKINQKNLWKIQAKGTQKIKKDMVITADISQSQEEIIQELIKPKEGDVNNNLPDSRDIQLWTKISFEKNNPFYRFFIAVDNQRYLNTSKLGIPFTHKSNYESEFKLKKEKITVQYKNINQDQLEINPLNPTENRTKAPLLKDESYKITLGTYPLNDSDFFYGYQLGYVNDNDQVYTYNPDGTYTENTLIDQHKSLGLTLGNHSIPIGILGNLKWDYQGTYKNFVDDDPTDLTTSKADLTSLTHNNKVVISTPIYSNEADRLRMVDLTIKNEIPLQYRFSTGNAPDDLKLYNFQNNEFSTLRGVGEKLVVDIGTLTLENSVQQQQYTPFQEHYISQKTTEWFSQGKIKNSKLSFKAKHDKQFSNLSLKTQKIDEYTTTFNSNLKEMYQYSFKDNTNFNSDATRGKLTLPISTNSISNYNYSNTVFAFGYQNVNTFGLDQSQEILNTVAINEKNHFWTVVLDDQKNTQFSRYLKMTYGYGHNYVLNDPNARTTAITLGLIDKSHAYNDSVDLTKNDHIKNIDPDKKEDDTLFPDEVSEVNTLLLKDDNLSTPFNLKTVGETYQDMMSDDLASEHYRSLSLELSSTRNMSYAMQNSFSPMSYLHSFTNYAIKLNAQIETYFMIEPFASLTRSDVSKAPTQAALGQTLKFQIGPAEYGYWLTLISAYDWAPNPNNPNNAIGISDIGIGIKRRVRAVEWSLSFENQWNYTLNQHDNVISLRFAILAFPDKGISYNQNGNNRGLEFGL